MSTVMLPNVRQDTFYPGSTEFDLSSEPVCDSTYAKCHKFPVGATIMSHSNGTTIYKLDDLVLKEVFVKYDEGIGEDLAHHLLRNCPYVLHMISFHFCNDLKHLVFRYYKYGDLAAFMNTRRLSRHLKSKWTIQLISAVSAVHNLGIVHRDIKPQNVLVDDNLNLKLTDFGISQWEGTKAVYSGTLKYFPPEYLDSDTYTADLRHDIWMLGCTLFFIYTGTELFNSFPGNEYKTVNRRLDAADLEEYQLFLLKKMLRPIATRPAIGRFKLIQKLNLLYRDIV